LCIGPGAPAKHGDNAKNNSKWIVLDDEHDGVFFCAYLKGMNSFTLTIQDIEGI